MVIFLFSGYGGGFWIIGFFIKAFWQVGCEHLTRHRQSFYSTVLPPVVLSEIPMFDCLAEANQTALAIDVTYINVC